MPLIKHLLLTTIAAVFFAGWGNPDFWQAASISQNIEAVKIHLAAGVDVDGKTPVDRAMSEGLKETADLFRKHSGKTAEEFKAGEK